MIALQLREFSAAAMLASALNRTLLLPRLMCGDEPMAYPCYAWYHRAMAYFGWATSQRVNLPRICPVYYWLDEEKLQRCALRAWQSSAKSQQLASRVGDAL